MNIIYFDNSATTKSHPEVINEVSQCMDKYFANPSSAHRLGLEAERKIKAARISVSNLIGAQPEEIIFTSGGTEANNMAIRGAVSQGSHVISTKIEHPSVLITLQELEKMGLQVTYLDVDKRGVILLDQLESSIKDDTRLVTIMQVNNEIGTIQPIEEIAKIVKRINKRTKVHVDAVQSLGKIKIDVSKSSIDMMSMSAHKIHGPKGVGALYIRKGFMIKPIVTGGGQEGNVRSGTENVPAISGFGTAANIISEELSKKIEHVNNLKSHFVKMLDGIDGFNINSPIDDVHIGNILNVSFENVRGEVLLHALEDYNIYVSTGSACSAKDTSHKNHVLPAIGLKKCHIEGAIRFSFSYLNTLDEVNYTIDALKTTLPFLRRIKK